MDGPVGGVVSGEGGTVASGTETTGARDSGVRLVTTASAVVDRARDASSCDPKIDAMAMPPAMMMPNATIAASAPRLPGMDAKYAVPNRSSNNGQTRPDI
jgi:hypothetical protein